MKRGPREKLAADKASSESREPPLSLNDCARASPIHSQRFGKNFTLSLKRSVPWYSSPHERRLDGKRTNWKKHEENPLNRDQGNPNQPGCSGTNGLPGQQQYKKRLRYETVKQEREKTHDMDRFHEELLSNNPPETEIGVILRQMSRQNRKYLSQPDSPESQRQQQQPASGTSSTIPSSSEEVNGPSTPPVATTQIPVALNHEEATMKHHEMNAPSAEKPKKSRTRKSVGQQSKSTCKPPMDPCRERHMEETINSVVATMNISQQEPVSTATGQTVTQPGAVLVIENDETTSQISPVRNTKSTCKASMDPCKERRVKKTSVLFMLSRADFQIEMDEPSAQQSLHPEKNHEAEASKSENEENSKESEIHCNVSLATPTQEERYQEMDVEKDQEQPLNDVQMDVQNEQQDVSEAIVKKKKEFDVEKFWKKRRQLMSGSPKSPFYTKVSEAENKRLNAELAKKGETVSYERDWYTPNPPPKRF